jgi:hypothetical protein
MATCLKASLGPSDFLNFAVEDSVALEEERHRVNSLGNSKRAIDSQIDHLVWGDPLKCHRNFGHNLRLHFNVFASPSKGWGLGKGTAFESPSPDSPVEIHSSFSLFPSFTINWTVAPRESAAGRWPSGRFTAFKTESRHGTVWQRASGSDFCRGCDTLHDGADTLMLEEPVRGSNKLAV